MDNVQTRMEAHLACVMFEKVEKEYKVDRKVQEKE